MLQLSTRKNVYDVCIIGSGAGGGTAAKVLTEGGLNVVMLEAGPRVNPYKDYKEHVWPYELARRGADIGGRARLELNTEFMAPNGFTSARALRGRRTGIEQGDRATREGPRTTASRTHSSCNGRRCRAGGKALCRRWDQSETHPRRDEFAADSERTIATADIVWPTISRLLVP